MQVVVGAKSASWAASRISMGAVFVRHARLAHSAIKRDPQLFASHALEAVHLLLGHTFAGSVRWAMLLAQPEGISAWWVVMCQATTAKMATRACFARCAQTCMSGTK